MERLVKLAMTRSEAYALLRALASAAGDAGTDEDDKCRHRWVATRLFTLLSEGGDHD